MSGLEPYQERFIELLVEHDVICFGEFTLKSGRKSPYFINAGQLRTGRAIHALGRAYADRILADRLEPDVVFGPSYKGVPLAVATAIALAEKGHDAGFAFDRKEAKEHGDGGILVGAAPRDGQSVVIVDDVITSGSSIEHSARLLQSAAAVKIVGVVVAVDRQERGGARSTLQELSDRLGAPVLPLVTIRQVVEHLLERRVLIGDEERLRIEEYLGRYGAPGWT